MKNKKITQFVTTSMIASALIFSYGTGSALATEDTIETNVPKEANESVEIVNEEVTVTNSVEEKVAEEIEKTEAPALVPGDFFYFVKSFLEKIHLALTTDDYEEAELLAEIAAERIAEANVLINEGKTESAANLLKEAVAIQESAGVVLDQTKEEANAATVDTEVAVEMDSEVAKEEATESDEPITDEEEIAVDTKLSNNITALLAALQKIDNPKAQQSLMKNIEKSFAKLDKKIQKLEKKNVREEAEEVTSEEVANMEASTEELSTEESNENNVETVANEELDIVKAEVTGKTTKATNPVISVKTETKVKESKNIEKNSEFKKQQGNEKEEKKKQQAKVDTEGNKQAGQAKAEEKKNDNAKNEKKN